MTVAAPPRQLTERSALDLARAIREREVSAREVVERHIEKLLRANLNAVVAERFDDALAEADAADERVAGGDGDVPPLLGVPCTIKESIAVTGMPNSARAVEPRRSSRRGNRPGSAAAARRRRDPARR